MESSQDEKGNARKKLRMVRRAQGTYPVFRLAKQACMKR